MAATPAIIWNGNTITLSRPFTAWSHSVESEATWRRSIDGHKNTHYRRYLWKCHLLYKKLTADQEMEILSWWSWASQGGVYAVAKDSTKTLSTTLDGSAAAAQTLIPLTTTTTAVAGDYMVLTTAERTYYEVVKVASVDPGVSITASANLKRAFASGDSCRHMYYYPYVTSVDSDYPIVVDGEGESNVSDFDHTIEESLT